MEKITRGRITYFEPNELFGGDNQPVNQEDLTKYVNLSVRIPSRFYNEGEIKQKYDSVLNGKPFFEKNEKGEEYVKLYLTDNYVNTSYTEFGRNGEINYGELFGIKSISISFDVQFFPQVTIEFSDVKGFGLMSTMENKYEKNDLKNLSAKSFFTSLFNFPYPMFTLEVKGYYGRSVSFDLSLKDFHTSFDSNTGNFNTTVSFIGYLYGVYADLPMSLMLISPYIDGKVKNDKIEKGDFWNDLGYNEIPTYLEVVEKYKKILRGESASFNDLGAFKKYNDITKKIEANKEIINLYDNIIEECKYTLKNWGYDSEKSEFIPTTDEDKILLNRVFKDLQNNNRDYYLENDHICFFALNEKKDINDLSTTYKKLMDGIINGKYSNKYELKVEKSFFSESKYVMYEFSDIFGKKNELIKENDELRETDENEKEVTITALNDIIVKEFGFTPNIENVYKILFKHVDCFSKHFFNTIKNIKKRTKDSLEIKNFSNKTDFFEFDDNGVIPPFPMFLNEENCVLYPGHIKGFETQPEVELVEKIFEKINVIGDNFKLLVNEVDSLENIDIKEYNICSLFGDLNKNIAYTQKNYWVLHNNKTNLEEGICKVFLARFSTFLKMHYKKDETNYNGDLFAKRESLLLKDAFQELGDDIIIKMSNLNSSNIYDFFKKLSGGTDWGFINYAPGDEEYFKSKTNHNPIKTHSNSDIESSVIILAQGTSENCSLYYNNIQNDEYKVSFSALNTDKIRGLSPKLDSEEGFQVFTYHGVENKKELFYTHHYGDTECRYHTNDWHSIGVYDRKAFFALGGNIYNDAGEIIVGNDYLYDMPCDSINYYIFYYFPDNYVSPFFSTNENMPNFYEFFNESYSIKKDFFRQTEEYGWDGYKIIFREYNEEDTKRENINKISFMQLSYLLAAGEALYWGENSGYVIALKQTNVADALRAANNGGGSGYSETNTYKYLSKCKNDTIFGKAVIALYKYWHTEYHGGQMTLDDEEQKILTYFNIPKIGWDNPDTYFLVIGKNFQYSMPDGVDEKFVKSIWDKFITNVKDNYNITGNVSDTIEKKKNKKGAELQLKTGLYYSLKNLYDKWYCSFKTDFFKIDKKGSEFEKIKYLTTTYNDISDKLLVDVDNLYNQIISIISNHESYTDSVISYMSKIAEYNNCTFLSLPLNIFNKDEKDIFKPFNFYDGTLEHDLFGSTYVVMYNTDVSHVLDSEENEYVDDGYMIADYFGENISINDEALKVMEVLNDHDYKINAFGVTYGMQNQNYFKNISVDTQTPQTTEYSISNMLNIAESGGGNITNKHFNNVNSIYPFYSNRSYTCSVDMMGCMYITPLMYFQLNNIPMFKGAYIIINVEHRISPNDFTTTFTGVRVSKYKVPVNNSVIGVNRMGNIIETMVGNIGIEQGGQNGGQGGTTSTEDVDEYKGEVTSVVQQYAAENITFKCIKNYEKAWYPYSGATRGKTVDKKTYYNYADDCMASVRKSIAILLSGDQNANAQSSTVMKYTSATKVVQLLYEKYDNTLSGGSDYKLWYEETCVGMTQKYQDCLSYMMRAIDNGYPVCVGVNHSVKRPANGETYNGKWLNEGITDHFLCVYGYGQGQADGNKVYFKFFESGRNGEDDCYASDNILIYENDPIEGKIYFYCPISHRNTNLDVNKRYDVSQIRIHPDILSYLGESQGCAVAQKYVGQFTGDRDCIDRRASNRYLFQKGKIK